jgi:hypothetical protein
MKINLSILLFISFLLSSCYNQQRNCKDFKTGKFLFTQEINEKKETSTFERTNSLQIETYKGKTDSATVRWVSDCEFILQKINPKTMAERKAISMKILSSTNDSYIFEYGFVGDSKKQRGTVTKIE